MIAALFLAVVISWEFEPVASYGGEDGHLLSVAANVAATDTAFYLLDAGLSKVVEIRDDGLVVEHYVGGEGPGECMHANTIATVDSCFLLLKPMKATGIFASLPLSSMDMVPWTLRMPELMLARNLVPVGGGYMVNAVVFDTWENVLALLGPDGMIHRVLIRESRDDGFPVWFYRNAWAVGMSEVVVEIEAGVIEVIDFNGMVVARRRVDLLDRGPSGGVVQSAMNIDGDLYVVLRGNRELELKRVGDWTTVRTAGVRHDPDTQYQWAGGHLVAIEGYDGRVFGEDHGDQEHVVVIYRRRQCDP